MPDKRRTILVQVAVDLIESARIFDEYGNRLELSIGRDFDDGTTELLITRRNFTVGDVRANMPADEEGGSHVSDPPSDHARAALVLPPDSVVASGLQPGRTSAVDRPWHDRGHLRDGTVYCMDPACRLCDAAISMREGLFPGGAS